MESLSNCPICDCANAEIVMFAKDKLVSHLEFSIVKCNQCDFLYTNPRPSANEIGKYYDSSEYNSHAENNGIFGKMYSIFRSMNIRYKIGLVKTFKKDARNILDYGCGVGSFLLKAKKKKLQSMGFEPNSKAAHIAIESGVKIVSINELKENHEASFDVITLWHVLEHIHPLNEMIKFLRSLLNEGGIMLIAVPNAVSYDAIHYEENWAALDVPRHLYHFTKENFIALFNKYSLKTIAIEPLKMDAYYISLLSEKSSIWKYPKALYYGWKSNLKASKNGNYSSLIFILQRDKQ